jgi:ABC-2 type transport system permease protein
VPVALLPGWLRHVVPASPGYWALAAYHGALAGSASQLGRPLAVLGVFALAGAGAAALIGARQRAGSALSRRDRAPGPGLAAPVR